MMADGALKITAGAPRGRQGKTKWANYPTTLDPGGQSSGRQGDPDIPRSSLRWSPEATRIGNQRGDSARLAGAAQTEILRSRLVRALGKEGERSILPHGGNPCSLTQSLSPPHLGALPSYGIRKLCPPPFCRYSQVYRTSKMPRGDRGGDGKQRSPVLRNYT